MDPFSLPLPLGPYVRANFLFKVPGNSFGVNKCKPVLAHCINALLGDLGQQV